MKRIKLGIDDWLILSFSLSVFILCMICIAYVKVSAYNETRNTDIQETYDQPVENESKFMIISEEEVENGATLYILVDKETRVEYLFASFSFFPNRIDSRAGISITPIYHADGSLKLYEGELK